MIKKAVIVAAGLSSRLYPLTLDQPKGLLPIHDEAILSRSISMLKKHGIAEIAIVVGYKKEKIMNTLGADLSYIFNPFYQHCNNMGSLWFAKQFINDEPFVYLHGDIVYDEQILELSLEEFYDRDEVMHLVTDFSHVDEEAMKVRIDANSRLIESNKDIPLDESAGEWTGIAYIRDAAAVFRYIEDVLSEEGLDFYDTHAFTKMAQNNYAIYCSSTRDLPWIEIDFLSDYEKAKDMFKHEIL